MKLDSLKPLLSGHYILNPIACLLYVILRCLEPFCGWLFPGEECQISWVSWRLRILLTLFHTHACFRSQACLIKSTSVLSNSIYVFTINSLMTQNKRIMVEIKFSYSRLSLCIVSYHRHLFFSGSISALVTSLNSWNRIHNFFIVKLMGKRV